MIETALYTAHSHRDWLPPNPRRAIIKPKGIDDVPIVALTFWTSDPNRSAFDLRVAHAAEVEFKRIKWEPAIYRPGPDHAIRVVMDSERMNAFAVTLQDLTMVLKVGNAPVHRNPRCRKSRTDGAERHLPAIGGGRASTRCCGTRRGREPQACIHGDAARVEDGPDQPAKYVWFGSKDGEVPAVTADIQKARRQCRRCCQWRD